MDPPDDRPLVGAEDRVDDEREVGCGCGHRGGRSQEDLRDTVAVDDLSFTVGRGEIFGILGPNGAGTVSYTHLTLPTKRIV